MTDIIRLNDTINDYAARPVITRLGEPDLAIRPSTYLDALGESTNIDPEQLLVDGIHGQTVNPTPFIGNGTGAMTVKSDADGAYLAMPQKGIRTDIVIGTRNDRGALAIIKYRVNDIVAESRFLSVGSGTGSTANFRLDAVLDPKRTKSSLHTGSHPLDGLVHTAVLYIGETQLYILDGVVRNRMNDTVTRYPNGLTGVGINTRSNSDMQPNDLDLYDFELYLDVDLTEQQIMDYVKTL